MLLSAHIKRFSVLPYSGFILLYFKRKGLIKQKVAGNTTFPTKNGCKLYFSLFFVFLFTIFWRKFGFFLIAGVQPLAWIPAIWLAYSQLVCSQPIGWLLKILWKVYKFCLKFTYWLAYSQLDIKKNGFIYWNSWLGLQPIQLLRQNSWLGLRKHVSSMLHLNSGTVQVSLLSSTLLSSIPEVSCRASTEAGYPAVGFPGGYL